MSENTTHNIPDGRSFEERVFARFDALDSRMGGFDTRLQVLESQAGQRGLETKPIWERALQEIVGTRTEVAEVRAEVVSVGDRLGRIENEVKDMRRMFRATFADVARVQADLEERLDKVEGREQAR